jgi:diacylglycerol kinase (ATP)
VSVLILWNPKAGYHQPDCRDAVMRVLEPLGPVTCVVPGSPEATTAAARDAEARGVELIVAAGGDGTVHRVVNGLTSVATHVGLLPLGTANDLAAHLGVPRSPVAAARAMLSGVTLDIDAIRINHTRVLTVGGFAIVAEAALLADAMKRQRPWLGTLVYKLAAARVIAARGTDPIAGSFVANQSTLGGHMRLPCESACDDGVCEVVTLAGGSRVRLARTLLAMTLGAPMPKDAVRWMSVARTTIEFDRDVPVFGDGEDLGAGRLFQISVESAAVRVRVARAAASEGTFAVQTGKVNVMAISSATE